jgi:hypothetical protein
MDGSSGKHPPQQITHPLTHPLLQVNHHCDSDTPILTCECSLGQAKRVQPQQPLGHHVGTHQRTDDNGGSVSMGFDASACSAPWCSSARPS